jgi:hypothetical protein
MRTTYGRAWSVYLALRDAILAGDRAMVDRAAMLLGRLSLGCRDVRVHTLAGMGGRLARLTA